MPKVDTSVEIFSYTCCMIAVTVVIFFIGIRYLLLLNTASLRRETQVVVQSPQLVNHDETGVRPILELNELLLLWMKPDARQVSYHITPHNDCLKLNVTILFKKRSDGHFFIISS